MDFIEHGEVFLVQFSMDQCRKVLIFVEWIPKLSVALTQAADLNKWWYDTNAFADQKDNT